MVKSNQGLHLRCGRLLLAGVWLPLLMLLAGVWLPLLMLGAEAPAKGPTAEAQTKAPTPEEGWQEKLADPAFRARAEKAGGVSYALRELAGSPGEQSGLYEWLQGNVKTAEGHALECLLRAYLARDLERPAEEISAADDLLLRAAPGLPQGWFGRAEQYEAGKEKESAAWAAEAAAQGMRRVNLAAANWQEQLHGYRGVDWLAHAVKTDHLMEWVKAVAAAVENAPRGTAREDACSVVLTLLRHDAVRKEPLLAQTLLEAVEGAQPQMVLGEPASFLGVMRDLQAAGQKAMAQRVARLLVFAPIAKGEASTGISEMLGMWESSGTARGSAPRAWQILQTAMGDDETFAASCLEAAQQQPWNENLVTHALLAQALRGGLGEEHLQLMAKLGAESRARVALRMASFAPEGVRPQTAAGPWMEEVALSLLAKMQTAAAERPAFASLLDCLERLERSGDEERLSRVLEATGKAAPRLNDLDHWERYARILLGKKQEELASTLALAWGGALDQSSEQKEHLLPLARTAIRAGRNGGGYFATMALKLWEKHHAEMTTTTLPPPGMASRVGEALMACDDVEGFERFVNGLEKLPKHRISGLYPQMTKELGALRNLITGKDDMVPAVDAWVRMPEGEKEAPRVEWQLVLPELGPSSERPMVLTTGDRDGKTEADKLSDARWWRAGTALPALERFSGKFTLEVLAGDDPQKLRSLAYLPKAPARGGQTVDKLPRSGSLKIMLRSLTNAMTFSSEPRAFSTHAAVFMTGGEPAAETDSAAVAWQEPAVPQPASWQPDDAQRWGRMIATPVRLEEGAEYLLTTWPAKESSVVRMILLDEEQRPLGPVPVASNGWQPGRLSLTHTPADRTSRYRTQRFRPGDWAGDGDLVFPTDGRAGEQRARFIAFVTRDAVVNTLPALQLRTYRTATMAEKADSSFRSHKPELPELNDEYIGDLGFSLRSWHVTFVSDRGILTGKGGLAGFDVTHIPWKPLVRAESELLEGNEWPMCFTPEHSLIIEPTWNSSRTLGLRFVPFDTRGERYAACRRIELPLPSYNRGEISEWNDGAVLMVSSEAGENPEPACAWVEPDGKCHVVKLPRPPIKNKPGLEVAWWGPGGTLFTLHEDGLLFHMEHRDGLRLLSVEPGSPDDIPEGAMPGRSKRKREWRLERPDVLIHVDKKTNIVTHRYRLPKRCEGLPMAFASRGYVILFTTEHEIIRVNPPDMVEDDD
ncbi:hypothetical protein [Prosthecobacter sp.]|uniref:hypothetical protein n=1 Tax=Prosthecobacter sp. TaxID=1965333 RepID=UPI003784E61F